jgi:hypothetical protein
MVAVASGMIVFVAALIAGPTRPQAAEKRKMATGDTQGQAAQKAAGTEQAGAAIVFDEKSVRETEPTSLPGAAV